MNPASPGALTEKDDEDLLPRYRFYSVFGLALIVGGLALDYALYLFLNISFGAKGSLIIVFAGIMFVIWAEIEKLDDKSDVGQTASEG